MSILKTVDLSHNFSGLQVLTGVNLDVQAGERHAVIGPNGAGKTTLFNVITGRYHASGGQVLFKKQDVTRATPYELNRLGMGRSFQITSTFGRQTAFENIRLGIMSKRGIRFNMFRNIDKMDEITQETDDVLKRINLTEQRNIPASMLSYGKGRVLEISMAMATNPDLIMLDEPTAGISKDETKHVVELIKQITGNKSMVIIEHDMDVVFSLADRITVLHHGEILACGTPAEIRNNQKVKDSYLGEMDE